MLTAASANHWKIWGQRGFPHGKGYKFYFICRYTHTYIYMYMALCICMHTHIYIHTHISMCTYFLDKISAENFNLPAKCQNTSCCPTTDIFPSWNISFSSELLEGIEHPLRHTDASNSKIRQHAREGRQQLSEGTHYIQRTGGQESKTISPIRFCSHIYLQEKSLEKTWKWKESRTVHFKIWWQKIHYF